MDIITELEKFINNSKECAIASGMLIEKAVSEENYMKATEMKVSKALHEMFAYRLQRIVDGKPAFEEPRPSVLIKDNGTIYG